MNCPRCGHHNAEDSRFCSNCGAQLGGRVGAPAEGSPETGQIETGYQSDRTAIVSSEGLSSTAVPNPGSPSTAFQEPGGSTEQADVDDPDGLDGPVTGPLAVGTALLLVKRGPNAGSRFLLDQDRTEAGRHPDSHILLDDVTVSRRHADFVRTPAGEFSVRDVGSLNGTYVNGHRIDEATLTGGDEVQIGKFRLAFFAGPGGPVPAGAGAAAGAEEPVDQR